jgi:mannitol-1-phosphate/altronate dehydrogenase
MKAKELKKLIEKSISDAIHSNYTIKEASEPEVDLADYNEEISERFKNLVLNSAKKKVEFLSKLNLFSFKLIHNNGN